MPESWLWLIRGLRLQLGVVAREALGRAQSRSWRRGDSWRGGGGAGGGSGGGAAGSAWASGSEDEGCSDAERERAGAPPPAHAPRLHICTQLTWGS